MSADRQRDTTVVSLQDEQHPPAYKMEIFEKFSSIFLVSYVYFKVLLTHFHLCNFVYDTFCFCPKCFLPQCV